MSDELLVNVEQISKKFCRNLGKSLWYGTQDIVGELLCLRENETKLRSSDEFWAIRDVSFTLKRGEALGIIGRNGAGKSTLLKMLNGLIKPDAGSITMRGQVQALIELGAGFNPVLTGRENIYVNAAVLGIPKQEIDKKLDEIIDFSELEEFIDAPVQSYSSGMKVRLGFAVAINVCPDVLIIDEVLAVGDQRFRRKARNAMAKLLESNVALIFISHNIHEVLGITNRALWLDHGKVVRLGDTPTVCAEYSYESRYGEGSDQKDQFEYMNKRSGELPIVEVSGRLNGQHFDRRAVLDASESKLKLELTYQAIDTIDEPVFHILEIRTMEEINVGYIVIDDFITANKEERVTRCFSANLDFLHPGNYQIAYELGTQGGPRLEGIQNLIYLDVKPRLRKPQDCNTKLNSARMSDDSRGTVLLPFALNQ
jgi:ABC-type polysaccharide/polyol phosphate transport system ATPase subunit